MGRAGGGRVGRGTSVFGRILRRRVDSVAYYANVDQLVDYLRSNYPQYARLPRLIFTKRVHRTLHSSGKANDGVSDDSNGHEQKETSPGKKRKEFDDREVKLRNKRRNCVVSNNFNSSSASSWVSVGSDCDTTSVGDGVDLMKSMLRENYCGTSKKKSGGVEGQREVVVVNQKGENGTEFGERKESDAMNNYANNNGPKFEDLGGMREVIQKLIEELVVPFCRSEVMQHLGLEPMRGILLHGPPGCGKTNLARAIANEMGVPFYEVSATELVAGVSGASEENIRDLFAKAYRTGPSVIFIDEIDAIASKKENLQRETDRRIVTQLMTCMDRSCRIVKPFNGKEDSESSSNSRPGHVLVIGATNRPDDIDPALRRPGRFDYEFGLGVPDEEARVEILRALIRNVEVEGVLDLEEVARSTPGFVGADLVDLVKRAGILALKRVLIPRKDVLTGGYCKDLWRHPWPWEELEKLGMTNADFKEAAKMVQPSSKREGFSTLPDVKWDDVGGLLLLRQELDRQIVRGIKHPEVFKHFGMKVETGILLYGPPGCGKTLIAQAVANEAGANFIHIKSPELLNKYVGESESSVRTKFRLARTCSPCILFFDEVDALTRSRGREGGRNVETVVNQLLLELDGGQERRGVYVIGATNRPEVMDPCLLRPGRFATRLYVPLPSPEERGMILIALAARKEMKIDASVDLMAIGKSSLCKNFSGADLSELLHEASRMAMDELWVSGKGNPVGYSLTTVKYEHIKRALEKINPSVSEEQIQYYENLSRRMQS